MSEPSTSHARICLAILGVALLLRLMIFPHHGETRDIDETGYLKGSLAILEGLPAGNKAAPGGPNLWVGWCYAGAEAALHLLLPGPEERRVPLQIRPFVALDHALFDQYRDLNQLHIVWIVTQLLLAIWATSAAWRIGIFRAGLAGGIFLAGSFAVLPMFVEFTDMSRPYMTAWSFGVLSLFYAIAQQDRRRIFGAGIFLGLAVASRIEMLLLAPLVLWEFWDRPGSHRVPGSSLRVIGVAAAAAQLAAPWLLTHLIGNLRTIATVRLGDNPLEQTTLTGNLMVLSWNQGLAGAMLAFIALIVMLCVPSADPEKRRGGRIRLAALTIYVAILLASLGKGTIYLHQQGPIVLALIFTGAFAIRALYLRTPKFAQWIVLAVLLLPLGQAVAMIVDLRKEYFPEVSAQWVEEHVPAGTVVYVNSRMRDPLPTEAAATAIWDEVTDDAAWRKKFESGLERFHVSGEQIPRAMSEENLVQERGNRRRFFILGGRTDLPDPRYDLRLYNSSPIFGIHEANGGLQAAFAQTGGVIIWSGKEPPTPFGRPAVSWISPHGTGIYIFASPDVKLH